jgi:AraC-like DNA-binding protein
MRSASIQRNITLYLCIVFIVSSVGFFLLYKVYIEDSYKNEIASSITTGLKSVALANAQFEEDVYRTAVKISLDPQLSKACQATTYDDFLKDTDAMMTARSAMKLLSDTVYFDQNIAALYVFPQNYDYYISSSCTVQKRRGVANPSLEYYLGNILQTPQEKDQPYQGTGVVSKDSANYQYFMYEFTIDNRKTDIVALVTVNRIQKIYAAADTINSTITRVVNNKSIVPGSTPDKTAGGADLAESLMKADANKVQGYSTYGKNLMAYYRDSANSLFIGEIPVNSLFLPISHAAARWIIGFLFICLCAIVITPIVVKRLYRPVTNLVNKVSKYSSTMAGTRSDAVDILSASFNSLIEREDELVRQLESHVQHSRDYMILNLINNRLSSLDLGQLEQSGPLFFMKEPYLVLSIKIDDLDGFKREFGQNEQYYLKILLLDLFEKAIGIEEGAPKCYYGLIVDEDHLMAIISDSIWEQFSAKLDLVTENVKAVLKSSVTVGVSQCGNNVALMSKLYSQSKTAAAFRFIKGAGKVILYDDCPAEPSEKTFNLAETRISSALLACDVEAAFKALSAFLQFFDYKRVTISEALQMMEMLSEVLISVVQGNKNIEDGRKASMLRQFSLLTSLETLDRVSDVLKPLFYEICSADEVGSEEMKYVSEIKAYISQHYYEQIDIASIAGHIHLSYSHARKLFKEKTGENITDFLNNLRLDRARQLLRETNQPVSHIAVISGFTCDQNLVRVFKKSMGITPGEYRKNIQVSHTDDLFPAG